MSSYAGEENSTSGETSSAGPPSCSTVEARYLAASGCCCSDAA
jgi:hypothetical protein